MVEKNEDGNYTAFVEIFKTGLAVTQVFVEFPKNWTADATANGKELLQKAREQLSVSALLISK